MGAPPRASCCLASAPLGDWKTTTFVAGLRHQQLTAPKVAEVQEAIAAAGAKVLYLPPYSPDLNPIEKLFSKLKALLRKAAKRSIDELWQEIGELLNTVSSSECANYFASSGYVYIYIRTAPSGGQTHARS